MDIALLSNETFQPLAKSVLSLEEWAYDLRAVSFDSVNVVLVEAFDCIGKSSASFREFLEAIILAHDPIVHGPYPRLIQGYCSVDILEKGLSLFGGSVQNNLKAPRKLGELLFRQYATDTNCLG